ncbi:MAG: hypothetical protein J2P25_12165 [Nocardiopsaceae bacterium]|nr:hypothetical protein [Nocardiopsaceae bacterium]
MPDDHDSGTFYEQSIGEPDQRDLNSPRMPVSPFRRPRPWAWALSTLMFIAGLVFLLLPVTALYYLGGHGNPYNIETIYGTRSDEMLELPAGMFGPGQPPTDVTSVRLGCGTAFSSGEGEMKEGPSGPKACSAAEQTRTIAGWLLVGLGILGFGVGFTLPSARFPAKRA